MPNGTTDITNVRPVTRALQGRNVVAGTCGKGLADLPALGQQMLGSAQLAKGALLAATTNKTRQKRRGNMSEQVVPTETNTFQQNGMLRYLKHDIFIDEKHAPRSTTFACASREDFGAPNMFPTMKIQVKEGRTLYHRQLSTLRVSRLRFADIHTIQVLFRSLFEGRMGCRLPKVNARKEANHRMPLQDSSRGGNSPYLFASNCACSLCLLCGNIVVGAPDTKRHLRRDTVGEQINAHETRTSYDKTANDLLRCSAIYLHVEIQQPSRDLLTIAHSQATSQ